MTQTKQNLSTDRAVRNYVIATYAVFWLMVLVICGGASMVLNAPALVMRILSNVCAWSPTIVLFAMFHKLRPNSTRKDFLHGAFCERVNVPLCLLYALITATGSLLSVWVLSLIHGTAVSSYFADGGYPIVASFFLSLLSGPTGEELGWRGYLRVELAARHSFLKMSVLQGVIWAFWHTVLWFVDSEFAGLQLIPYAIANVVVMTCLAIMMNVVLERRKNIVYSVAIHFAFNFVYCFLKVDLLFYAVMSVVFILIATGFLLYRSKTLKK